MNDVIIKGSAQPNINWDTFQQVVADIKTEIKTDNKKNGVIDKIRYKLKNNLIILF